MMQFEISSPYQPAGDQPQAIAQLIDGLRNQDSKQVLLGVTGSGKTYTVANVIQQVQMPTLVISHNKTLAAQLYQEFRDFFPRNPVSYFVSYYDYYQPEAYIPQTDTYIEKETDINDNIDKLRLAATANLLARKDVIVVASVSCIYNLGSPVVYGQHTLELMSGMVVDQQTLLTRLNQLQYRRSDFDLQRGTYRVRGELIDLYPAYQDFAIRIEFTNNIITRMSAIDPLTGQLPENFQELPSSLAMTGGSYKHLTLYAAKHYLTDTTNREDVFNQIKADLEKQVFDFKQAGKILEAHRIYQKVTYDLEMIQETGYVNGIENYSRYFDGRQPGQAPYTLLDYFNHNSERWLCVIDESHITIPQIRSMYNGDQARKQTLIEYGFRLPSALDNRPLRFEEFISNVPNYLFTSATPSPWEIDFSQNHIVQQLIRPTGLLDPVIEVRQTEGQIPNLLTEIQTTIANGQRVLVLTLTKRMAEDLSKYLQEREIKVNYLHSEIETLERTDILENLRLGEYDVIVGVNLLREGIDLPEVSLVAIMDADKEGFLRSQTSLMQIMGRAARHQAGRVIMYADRTTPSMSNAIAEVDRRRAIQQAYNEEHGIIPASINKPIRKKLIEVEDEPLDEQAKEQKLIDYLPASRSEKSDQALVKLMVQDNDSLTPSQRKQLIIGLRRKMAQAAKDMNFELAAELRDKVRELEKA